MIPNANDNSEDIDDKLFIDCLYGYETCDHDDFETMCDDCRGDKTADRADRMNDLD